VVNQRPSITVPKGVILREIPGAGTRMKEGSVVQVVLSSGPPPVSVPVLSTVTNDCPGVTAALAQAHLTANCSYQNSTTVAKGGVIDWNPKGTAIYGTSVSAIISSGPPIVTIPSLSGSTCSGATATLQALNLAASCAQDWSSTVPNGQVIDWNPKGNAPYGTTINIVVSKGPQPVVIPPIYQHTVSDAIAMLQAVGLNPVSGGGSLSGHVFLSDPPQGQSVPPGTTVTLYSR
jgi:serine/threonine-protein kinase